jgi:restriction system protein
VYPEHYPVRHEFTFDPSTAELSLRCLVPGPSQIPTTKAYKYAKAADEITEAELPQKATRDRYVGAVNQVALRSLHEVFEADRRGLIQSIALQVGTETLDPATGVETYVPFVAVGADRGTFTGFDLGRSCQGRRSRTLGRLSPRTHSALSPRTCRGSAGCERRPDLQPTARVARTSTGLEASGGVDPGSVLARPAAWLGALVTRRHW